MSDDVVNHPSHYNQYEGFEVIDVCEQLRAPDGSGNYNRGNALKYLARAGWKNPDKHVEDLEKAAFYIQREIDRIKSNNWMDTKETLIVDASYCPDCGTRLTVDGVCLNNHARAKAEAAKAAEAMEKFCPECGILLTASDTCPNGHGYLEKPEGNVYKYWVSVDNPEVCNACDSTMVRMLETPNEYYCPNGHGSRIDARKVV